ncbi:hypothetical protein EYV94_21070 [Puteibacter caeruleilacunae]|nr:hypothetical protein EYV94_21070 [Puteibacter caeruleilacunae]
MRTKNIYAAIALFTFVLALLGNTYCYGAKSLPKKAFKELDHFIEERESITVERQEEFNKLRADYLQETTINEKYTLAYKLSQQYISFNIDSALHYAEQALLLTNEQDDRQHQALLQLSEAYIFAGLYHLALDTLNELRKEQLPNPLLVRYHSSMATYYRSMHSYQRNGSSKIDYNALRAAHIDTVVSLINQQNPLYAVVLAEQQVDQGNHLQARTLLKDKLGSLEAKDHNYAITAYALANTFQFEPDTLNWIKYLAQSARSDVEGAVKENAALRELALLLYQTGDIERAYQYIKVALEDAIYSNARLRTFEVLEILPVIDDAFTSLREQKRKNILYFTWIASLLSLALLLSLFFLMKQKNKLAQANQEIKNINNKLRVTNQELKTSNELVSQINKKLVKSNVLQEEYIARYLKLCSTYIGKLDDYRNSIRRKATTSGKEDLIKMLKSKKIVDDELKTFYADFDKAFLKLYPDFVEQFNSLLKSDHQIILKEDELLNTELRIFALIRLGITESPQVAEFLRYSVTTIYNYRTQARNKAAVERDLFEQEVMRLGLPG